MHVRLLVSSALLLLLLAPMHAALAHGPCHCLTPSAGPPGTQVEIPASYGAVEVLWNPDPTDLSNPALSGSKWERFFHPNSSTQSLSRQSDPGPIDFRVPPVPDGKYLVVIFDLSEGDPRHHYTWGVFSVQPETVLPRTGTTPDALVLLSATLISLGAGISFAARVKGHPSDV